MIITGDGSHSLLNTALDETYHSRHGAVQESIYVFINKGLEHWLGQTGSNSTSILEIGFGTGLNALLTAQYSKDHSTKIEYSTLEAFPVEQSIWTQLNYADSPESKALFKKLHDAEWNKQQEITSDFKLIKIHDTLQHIELSAAAFDLIYYDAFAPNKQPEMWEYAALEKVVKSMKANSVFVTYCAKGQLKRDLRSLGLQVETLDGPPGKKEMIRATKSTSQETH